MYVYIYIIIFIYTMIVLNWYLTYKCNFCKRKLEANDELRTLNITYKELHTLFNINYYYIF